MHTFTEPLSYAGAFAASLGTLIASLEMDTATGGWLPLIVQAGMAGIVVLLVMKHIPAMQKANADAQDRFLNLLEKQNEAHTVAMEKERDMFRQVIERITSDNREQNMAWRDLIATRGYCPIRDTGDQRHTHHHHTDNEKG